MKKWVLTCGLVLQWFGCVIIVTVCVLIMTRVVFADVAFIPTVFIGYNSNSNINYSPTAPVKANYLDMSVSTAVSSYLNPALFYKVSYGYGTSFFRDHTIEQLQTHSLDVLVSYSLSPSLMLTSGFDLDYSSEVIPQSLLQTASETGVSYYRSGFTPTLGYYYSPGFGVELGYENARLYYVGSDFMFQEHRYTGRVLFPVNYWMTMSVEYDHIQSDSSNTIYVSKGSSIGGALTASLPRGHSFMVYYSSSLLTYPNWSSARDDTILTLSADYSFPLFRDDWVASFGISRVINDSSDATQSFTNQLIYGGVSWSPVFGTPYDHGASDYVSYLLAVAETKIDTGYFDTAVSHLEKVLFYSPSSVDAHFELGYIYHVRRDHYTAISHLETVVYLDPNRLEAYYLLAYHYLKTDQKELARMVLEVIREKRPDATIEALLKTL